MTQNSKGMLFRRSLSVAAVSLHWAVTSLGTRFAAVSICALFGFQLGGCGSRSLTPEQYLDWFRKNTPSLTIDTKQDDLQFSLTFQPAAALALRELGEDIRNVDAAAFHAKQQEYEGLEYYQFKINGPSDILKYRIQEVQEYYERVEYYSFQMQRDVRLIVGTDTLPCKLFHFERNYGAAPFLTFSLGFEPPTSPGDRRFQYQEPVFGLGLLELTIPQKNMDNLPTIKL